MHALEGCGFAICIYANKDVTELSLGLGCAKVRQKPRNWFTASIGTSDAVAMEGRVLMSGQ